MSQDWYLMTTPNQMSGFEDDYFSDYANESFNELISTFVGEDIIIYNSTMSISVILKGIVQSKYQKQSQMQILLPLNSCDIGAYIKYKNFYWLVIDFVNDNKMYQKAIIQLCNYTLKFQSTTGTILSYPCINSTSQNVGIDASKILSVGNGIHTIKVPFDVNTVLINTDRRFIIDDVSVEIPQVFAVSKPNRVEFKFGDKGIIELTMKQDVFNAQTDRKDLGICNYFDPTVVPIPPTTPTEIVTITSDATDNNIKLGLTYTFSATFKSELGVDITGVTAVYSLDTTYDGLVVLVDNGNKTCTLKVDENAYSLLTKNVVLTCMDTAHGFSAYVTLTIIGLF